MSYDAWKTRSPDDELRDADGYPNEEEPTELDLVYGALCEAKKECDRYRDVASGLYGLLVLISNRGDLSDELRDIIANNHRSVDAGNVLQPETRLEWPKF